MKDSLKNKILPSTLYIVSTPIGNLSDISERAIKILSEADFIAAEDTRVTGKLLAHFNINNPMISYHEYNKTQKNDYIIERLKTGESCALVTDAGTPAVSDPGEDIVRECIAAGINVTSVPGPCAAITALTLSGFDTKKFVFIGFINNLSKDEIEKLYLYDCTMILYEAPHRLKKTLRLLAEILDERNIAICRELTKINEEIIRMNISRAIEYYEGNEPRGEYVLIIEKRLSGDAEFWCEMTVPEHVQYYIDRFDYKKNDAVKIVAKDRKIAKNIIYKELI